MSLCLWCITINKLKFLGIVLLVFIALSGAYAEEDIVVEGDVENITIEDAEPDEEFKIITLGSYTVEGYNIERGSAREIAFIGIGEKDKIKITTEIEEEEVIIILFEIGGNVDDQGMINGLTFEDGAYIEIDGESYDLYEFYENVSFSYDIEVDELVIERGTVDVGGLTFNVDREISVSGGEVFAERNVYVEGLGNFKGRLTPSLNGVEVGPIGSEPGSFLGAGEEIKVTRGGVLVARAGFDPEFYGKSYYYETDGEFAMGTDADTVALYRAKTGNEILNVRNIREDLELNFDGPASVVVQNRDAQGLVPVMFIDPDSTGLSYRNGGFTDEGTGVLSLDEEVFNVQGQDDLIDATISKHSLPLVVNSGDQIATYSATNSVQLADTEGNSFLTINDLGIPITAELGRDIRTLDELAMEWPNIEFTLDEGYEENGIEPSAATVQSIDYWLSSRGDVTVDKFVLTSKKGDNMVYPEDPTTMHYSDVLYNMPTTQISEGDFAREEGILGLYRAESGMREYYGQPIDGALDHEEMHSYTLVHPELLASSKNMAEESIERITDNRRYEEMLLGVFEDSGEGKETFMQEMFGRSEIPENQEEFVEALNGKGFYNVYASLYRSGYTDEVALVERLCYDEGTYPYSYYNYGDERNPSYDEWLPTVYAERSEEGLRDCVNSPLAHRSQTCKDTINLMFASGKLDDASCGRIMGHACISSER